MVANTALAETDVQGSFVRRPSEFRDWIEVDGKFPPESGRYHLFISFACPWAHRVLIVRSLMRLQDIIGISVVHPTWERTNREVDDHCGWVFKSPDDPPLASPTGHGSFHCDGCISNTVNDAKTIRELYEMCSATVKKYTVPILWDKKSSTIVNNESSEIMRMLHTSFTGLCETTGGVKFELYPEKIRDRIDLLNEYIYSDVNDGVYKCGFAKTQQAYDLAVSRLFTKLDKLDELLKHQRYLAGDSVTEADIRLFVTLIRFDEVYVVYFKTNKKLIAQYSHLTNWMRDIYQLDGVRDTVNMSHIKTHYFSSHSHLNYYSVIPAGPGVLESMERGHGRDELADPDFDFHGFFSKD